MDIKEAEGFSEPQEPEERILEKIPKDIEKEFPEQMQPTSQQELVSSIKQAALDLSLLGFDGSIAERVVDLLTNPKDFSAFTTADNAIAELPEALFLKSNAYSLAIMSLMEFCRTYGCPKDSEELFKKWQEQRKVALPKRLRGPVSLNEVKNLSKNVLNEDFIVAKDITLSRLAIQAKRASEMLRKGKKNSFLAELSSIPEENGARSLAVSLALSEASEQGLDRVANILPSLDSFMFEIPQGKSLTYRSFKVDVPDAKAYLEVKKEPKKATVEVRAKDAIPIIVESYGNEKSLLVIVARGSRVTLSKGDSEEAIGEGKYRIKGPFSITVSYNHSKVVYEVREPMFINLQIRVKGLEKL